jgi:glycosyltransferase involved in cell wall biosynthesis
MISNRKKILLVLPNYGKGGMERQLSILLNQGVSSNILIDVALFRNKIEYSIPSNSNVNFIVLNKKYKIDLCFIFRLAKLIINPSYDLIHAKIPGPNEYIIVLCKLLNKKNFIIEFRNSGDREYWNYVKAAFLLRIFGLDRCRIICNSEKALRETKKVFGFFGLSPNAFCIKNGIDTNVFKKLNVIKENGKFVIGYVGRIAPQKNLECLIKAMALFCNEVSLQLPIIPVIYIIKSFIDRAYLNSIEKLIKSLRLENSINFFDTIDLIEEWYNKFDLFVLSSHEEGTPNVLLEAMACETVCILSNGANSDGFLTESFIFPTNDPQQLYSLIMKIIKMSEIDRAKIGRINRDFVVNQFSMHKMIDKYEEIWRE